MHLKAGSMYLTSDYQAQDKQGWPDIFWPSFGDEFRFLLDFPVYLILKGRVSGDNNKKCN